MLRDTRVANAATYYGIATVSANAALNDAVINVDDIFTQLVPASQAETPMVDLLGSGLSSLLVPGNAGTLTRSGNVVITPGAKFYVGGAVMPGTLSLTHLGNTYTDAGGLIKLSSATAGVIEYDKGLLSFGDATPVQPGASAYVLVFKPAANPTRSSLSASIGITQSSRGYNYTITLLPIPSPGSVVVSYMAQGKVYYLYDTGRNGVLSGSDSSFGAGSVNFTTGTVLVTLGVLPDADSELIFNWAVPVSTFIRSGITVPPAKLYFQLSNQQVTPGSVTATWLTGATTKTAADNGLGGFTGDATGVINYSSGIVTLTPALLPNLGATFNFAYQHGPPNETTFAAPARGAGGYITVTLPNVGGSVVKGSVELEFNVDVLSGSELAAAWDGAALLPPPANYSRSVNVKFFDHVAAPGDAVGGWRYPGGAGVVVYPGNVLGQAGTMTYASREVSFLPEVRIPTPIPTFTPTTFTAPDGTKRTSIGAAYAPTNYSIADLAGIMPAAGNLRVRWRTDSANTSATDSFTASSILYDLTPGFGEDIVTGSARFTVGGREYVDRAGSLYHSVDRATGSGTYGGTLGYQNGVAAISDWVVGGANTLTLGSLVTELALAVVSGVTFRVPIIPVRPGSIQVRAIAINGPGTEFTFTLDNTGNLVTSQVDARADYSSGVVVLKFGAELQITGGNRATVEAQPWYDAAEEYTRSGNTYIFEPKPVYADSIKYNAVGYTYLPLSADILGLDPVRLPSDGRVPIFGLGTLVIAHNTKRTVFPTPAPGSTLTTGRVRISYARLYDSLGARLPDTMRTVNLLTGTVTLTGSFSMTGYTAPLYVEDRIEDSALCTDVQINGRLALSKPLSHAYPATESYVSSALVVGDLQSRAHTVFSQQTWTNVWQDSRIGSSIIAQYNTALHPIVTTNRGALEERWAIIFETSTTYRVVGEAVGVIATAVPLTTNLAIENPNFPGSPYFTLQGSGGQWGSGWAAGNVLRFNTSGANYPIWGVRTVLQGTITEESDGFQVAVRGDVDRP
jgi:hypothetical protein